MIRLRIVRWVVGGAAVGLLSCGAEAGLDAGVDRLDPGSEVRRDAGVDRLDAGTVARRDAGVGRPDAGTESRRDAGVDEEVQLALTGFSPEAGRVGTPVTIRGSGFSSVARDNTVEFNGTEATVTAASKTSLTVTVPAGATSGPITVAVGGEQASSESEFTVEAALTGPAIDSFSPTSGPVGTPVTITGADFSTTAKGNTIKFNGATATVTAASSTSLTATVPAGATTGRLTVTVGVKTATSTSDFTVVAASASPSIASFSPTSGSVGASVTLYGANFSSQANSNGVKFNGTSALVTASSATALTVTVPAGASTGPITVTVGGKTATSASDFTVAATSTSPAIASFSPTSASVGALVTLYGTGFSSQANGNGVKFNGTAASVTAASATSLEVTVPSGASTGRLTVTVGGKTATSASDFTVDPATKPATGMIGWATVKECGASGTSGGEGGPTVTVTTASALLSAAKAAGKQVIQISGKIDLGGSTLQVASDKTLIGMNGGAEIVGYTSVKNAKNVILRNLKFNGGQLAEGDDTAEVSTATCVWIDHCEFFDGGDGNLDIVRGSDLVTVSWTKFYYVVRNHSHRLSNLCGNNDTDTPDKINITFHHNWWGAKVIERMPRVRHGKVHVFNNYFSSAGNNYCVGAGYKSKLLVENNFFDGVKDPIKFQVDQGTAEVVEKGNDYSSASGEHVSRGSAFTPPYSYQAESAQAAKSSVMSGAGVK
jgi:pectate lyase